LIIEWLRVQNSSGLVNTWPGPSGGYSAVLSDTNSSVDWYAVQFYNQGVTCYTTYDTLFLTSNLNAACPMYPGTSVTELTQYGLDFDKIVVGKITETYDGGNGYVAPATLGQYFVTANDTLQWNVGVGTYSYSQKDSAAWIAGVYPAAPLA
jgi:chitinase